MIRVLQCFDQMNNAGTEKAILNIIKNVTNKDISFELLVQKQGELDDIIKAMGIKIHYISAEKKKDYVNKLTAFFKEQDPYNAIHIHSHGKMGVVLKVAKDTGVKYRIIHSHNSRADLPELAKIYKLLKGIYTGIVRNSNYLFACSEVAAKWLFPLKWQECKIIDNAIELELYEFNEKTRKATRDELNIHPNDKVICHVGRFSKQKNHIRLIEILNRMVLEDNNVKALLIGEGELFEQIKLMSKSENIKFLGKRNDVPKLLNASDVFVLPSLHEGLPFVLVEAQANGLYSIASENVSAESDIGSGLLKRISLKESDDVWIETIKDCFKEYDRKSKSIMAYNSKYNVKTLGKKMEEFYSTL